jgi:hypothetical protein
VRFFPVHLVTEIASYRRQPLRQNRFPDIEASRYWDLALPGPAAQRFYEFYRRTMTRSDYPPYECHSLPHYVWGVEPDIRIIPNLSRRQGRGLPQPHFALEAGQHYLAIDAEGRATHSMLGLGEEYPHENVSILEQDAPLVVTNTADVRDLAGGETICPAIYQQAGRLAMKGGIC